MPGITLRLGGANDLDVGLIGKRRALDRGIALSTYVL